MGIGKVILELENCFSREVNSMSKNTQSNFSKTDKSILTKVNELSRETNIGNIQREYISHLDHKKNLSTVTTLLPSEQIAKIAASPEINKHIHTSLLLQGHHEKIPSHIFTLKNENGKIIHENLDGSISSLTKEEFENFIKDYRYKEITFRSSVLKKEELENILVNNFKNLEIFDYKFHQREIGKNFYKLFIDLKRSKSWSK